MISRSIPGISMGDHATTSELSDKNCLNNVFSWGCRFEPIRRARSGWCGFTMNDSGSSLVLLSGFPDSVGKSGSRLSPYCDCHLSAILFCFLSTEKSSFGPAPEALCTQSDLFRATATTVLTIAWSPLVLTIPDGVRYFRSWWWGGWDYPHQMDLWPPKDGVIRRFDVQDAELRDHIAWISSIWEFSCSGRTYFAPIESIEKRLGLSDNHFFEPTRKCSPFDLGCVHTGCWHYFSRQPRSLILCSSWCLI